MAVLCAGCLPSEPATPRPVALTMPATIRVGTSRGVVDVAFEDYVLGSVLSEISPVGESADAVGRIFEVQAILARTYALAHLGRHRESGFDVCDRTHCQLYEPARIGTSRFSEAAAQAVQRTRGLILVYAGRPIDAVFHADCGGHTSNADDVWGGAPVPYLVGRIDDVGAPAHRSWQFDAPASRLLASLNADPRTAIGARLDRLAIAQRDAAGRAARISLVGPSPKTVKGEDLRAAVNRVFGDRAIQSTRFTVRRTGATYRFEGSGFGHGVGLCQVGAAARARAGEPAAAILSAYFGGAGLASAQQERPAPALLEPFPKGW
jgi:stage II sporulation protein D